jgi:hypothetical protein
MKALILAAAVCSAVTLGSMAGATPAAARDSVVFSFNPDGVAFAYSDGYWDRDHRWHHWRNARESRLFRERYAERWNHGYHNRYPGGGWRDADRDGVPNRYDDHPFNPHRD